VPLRVTLDDEADAAYIYIADEISDRGVAQTVILDYARTMINLDFGPDGRVLGIEILGAGETLPTGLINRLRRS
jgi:uncharacterized protein YuzE